MAFAPKGQILKSVLFIHQFLIKYSGLLTSYLIKILKLACKLVHFFPRNLSSKTSISNFHIGGSTFVCQHLQKRPLIPFLALKWFYLCPSNEDKKDRFGDKPGEISTNFLEPKLRTTSELPLENYQFWDTAAPPAG